MTRKNIEKCAECGKPMPKEYRMVLMMGPKGFRRYPVHVDCNKAPAAMTGGRQKAKSLTPNPSPSGDGKIVKVGA